MKRFLSIILFLVLMVGCLANSVHALNAKNQEKSIVYFDDGSYLTITLEEIDARASGTKTGSKTYNYYASSGDLSWKAVITGTFRYTGSSATGTVSKCTVTIYDSAWYEVSNVASKNGNTAVADLTMGRKLLGITITKKSLSLQIVCDPNGNLS